MTQTQYQETRRVNRTSRLFGLAMLVSIGCGIVGVSRESKLLLTMAIGGALATSTVANYYMQRKNETYNKK